MILYYHELVLGYIENPPVHRLGTGGLVFAIINEYLRHPMLHSLADDARR